MSQPQTPALPANKNHGPEVIGLFWTEIVISMAVLFARLYARKLNKALGLDDYLMTFSWIMFLSQACIATYSASIQGFRHFVFVPPNHVKKVVVMSLIFESMQTFTWATSKFSVGYQIIRILPPSSRWTRWSVWISISVILGWDFAEAMFVWIRCIPAATEILGCYPSPEVNYHNILAGMIYNVLLDAFLALVPITFIWTLNLRRNQRIALCSLLGLGMLAAVCGAIKTSFVKDLILSDDPTWQQWYFVAWGTTEIFLTIVCGSIPPLKGLWDRKMHRNQYIVTEERTLKLTQFPSTLLGKSRSEISKDGEALASIDIEEAERVPSTRPH